MKSFVALALLLLLFPSVVEAQVVSVGPFGGHVAEGFETHTPGAASACLTGRIFDGNAEICTPLNTGATVATSWSFLCTLEPRRGELFYGSSQGMSVVHFDRPAVRFGGYFSTNAPGGTVTLRFFDISGGLIDQAVATVSDDCSWLWNGWAATEAIIDRVEIENSENGGAFVMLDELRADFAEIGSRYCVGAVNSTGQGARLAATGSTSLLASDLGLISTEQPPFTPGLFFYGAGMGQQTFGDGFLCVLPAGAGLQRLRARRADFLGAMRIDVDYGVGTPSTQIMPGSTWQFQALYRDLAAGGTNFNATDALSLTFGL